MGGQPGADPAEDRHQHQTGQDGPVQRLLLRHPFGEDQVRAGGVDQHGRQFQFYQDAEYQQDQEHGQDEKEHLLCQCQIPKHKKSSSICFEIYGFSYEYYLIFQKTCQKIHFRGDSNMEIKIPKEVHQHRETIFFGLSTRQFLCSALAVGAAVGVYFVFKGVVGQEAASWLCILAAAPIAVTGFFRYNGLTFERFVWAFLKSQVLCAGPRVYRAENIYLQAMPEQRKIWGTGKKP